MEETYCPFCKLAHNMLVEDCCICGAGLILRPDSSNGEDHNCPLCIHPDGIEMA